jgi:hypothetical protein
MPRLQMTPLLGLPTATLWSQVFRAEDGQLVIAYSVVGESASNVGRDIFDVLKEVEVNSAESFHALLTDISRQIHLKGCQAQIAAWWQNSESMVVGAQQAAVVLKRRGAVKTLLHSTGECLVIAGKSLPEDVVVLFTEGADQFRQELTLKLEQGYEPDTIITSLVPTLHGLDESGAAAICVIEHVDDSPALESSDLEVVPMAPTTPTYQTAVEIEESVPDSHELTFEEEGPSLFDRSDFSSFQPPKPWTPAEPVVPSPIPALPASLLPAGPSLLTRVKRTLSAVFQKSRQYRPATFGQPEVYLHPRSQKKLARIVVPVLVVVLIVAAVAGWFWSNNQDQVRTAQAATAEWRDRLVKAEALFESDPFQAREEISAVEAGLEGVKAKLANSSAGVKHIDEVLVSVRSASSRLSGSKDFQELPVFYDVSLAKSGMVATLADGSTTQAILVDSQARQLAVLDLENKQVELKELPAVPRAVALDGKSIYLLGDGIQRLPVTGTASATRLKDEGDPDKAATRLARYSDFTYLLNPERRAIYRFAPADGKLSEEVSWLKSPVSIELSEVESMAIDSDMYLGMKNGEIKRFTSGREQAFEVKGLTKPFSSPVVVVTRRELNNLYVLEPQARRVVVLSKSGEFLHELKSVSLGAATTLLVREEQKQILAVAGSLIFELSF